MPVYEYRCSKCWKHQNIFKSVDEYDRIEYCECGYEMIKLPSKVSLGFVNKFKNAEQRAKAEGFTIREPGMDKDAERNKQYREEGIRKNIRKHIEQTVSEF